MCSLSRWLCVVASSADNETGNRCFLPLRVSQSCWRTDQWTPVTVNDPLLSYTSYWLLCWWCGNALNQKQLSAFIVHIITLWSCVQTLACSLSPTAADQQLIPLATASGATAPTRWSRPKWRRAAARCLCLHLACTDSNHLHNIQLFLFVYLSLRVSRNQHLIDHILSLSLSRHSSFFSQSLHVVTSGSNTLMWACVYRPVEFYCVGVYEDTCWPPC